MRSETFSRNMTRRWRSSRPHAPRSSSQGFVVAAPNEYGMECPQLERIKKCNQFKCPVDCVESEWSGWSKCSKECESGVQVRTRSILTKAKNGGKACDTVQEEQSCHTGSCDRDCSLDDWTDW